MLHDIRGVERHLFLHALQIEYGTVVNGLAVVKNQDSRPILDSLLQIFNHTLGGESEDGHLLFVVLWSVLLHLLERCLVVRIDTWRGVVTVE